MTRILDPTLRAVRPVATAPLASRPSTLTGARIGLLANGKSNGMLLLERVAHAPGNPSRRRPDIQKIACGRQRPARRHEPLKGRVVQRPDGGERRDALGLPHGPARRLAQGERDRRLYRRRPR